MTHPHAPTMVTAHGQCHSHGPSSPHPAQAAPWSILRMTVAARLGARACGQRRALGRRLAGDEVSMARATAIPRCHAGLRPPSGGASSQRRGRRRARCWRWSVPTARANRRCFAAWSASSSRWPARSRPAASMSATSPICRRPPTSTAAFRFRCSISSAPGCGAHRLVRRHRQGRARRIAQALAAVGLNGFENRADRHAVGRADAAHAVCARAVAGCAR